MVVSSRAVVAVAVGLGLAVGPALGQQQDNAVRKTTSQSSAPKPPAPAVFGTVDIDAVFKGYDKVKASSDEFKAAALARKQELMKLLNEAQQENEMLSKLTPGSVDAKKHEDKLTALKAQHEANREQAEREFALREAEALATLYKEIQQMVGAVAKTRGMTYVIKVSNEPISGSNPNSVMAAMAKTVVYADARNDITNDVVFWLNRNYKAAGGVKPKAAATAPSGN
jgi:outer membrane protein